MGVVNADVEEPCPIARGAAVAGAGRRRLRRRRRRRRRAAETTTAPPPRPAKDIDYEAIGLWDDGPCDEAQDPLVDRPDDRLRVAGALARGPGDSRSRRRPRRSTSAAAPTARASRCTTCDDGGNADQARRRASTRSTRPASWPRSTTRAPPARPRCPTAMADGGHPPGRRRTSTNDDWGDQNAYPLDASGTGVTFLLPQALIDAGRRPRSGSIRVDLAAASALKGLLEDIYEGDGAPSPTTSRCPAGTTDFTPVHPGRRGRRRRAA